MRVYILDLPQAGLAEEFCLISLPCGGGLLGRSRRLIAGEALELLREARPKVLSGSREELEYVIFKTENFIKHFEVLRACYDAKVALDRAWLATDRRRHA